MSAAAKQLELADLPLERIDVSDPSIYQQDCWQPYFARLRKEAPLHYQAESDHGPFWSATSHRLIKQIDTDHSAFSSADGIAIVDPPEDPVLREQGVEIDSFITMDPPRHDSHRATVSPSVAPSNLGNFEPLIRERAVDILENLPVGETFNWVKEVSVELTARMLSTLFDFPYEERQKLIHWSDITTDVGALTGKEDTDMDKRREGLMECAGAFMQLWQDRAGAAPKFDLISMLAHGEETKRMIDDPVTFMGTILLLIVGGNDTTRNSISGGVIALNEFPDEYQKLRDNPGVIPNMVSEMIRWQTPVIHMRRTATRDFQLAGKTIKKGEKIVMWYLSGNRDESVFPDADRLVVDRPNARSHVAFGYGIHRCMGNRLAEMQLRILWEEIMARFKKVELAGEVVRLPNNFIRGIAEVPVRLVPK